MPGRILVAACSLTVACGGSTPKPALTPYARDERAVVHVQDRWLVLHLGNSSHGVKAPLVLFVTGDGGWRGKDLDAFHHLAAWGRPIAGFSAPDYLGHLSGSATSVPPRQLACDFAAVIAAASDALRLGPESKAVLVGVSRGGDLAVIAAAEEPLRRSVLGVMAVGLTGEEEYVRHRQRADAGVMVKPYDYLARLDLPVCLIQSTNDEYVPAEDARRLFGPDTPDRRFLAIDSRNHSFSDARTTLYDDMRSSLDWLIDAGRLGTGGAGGL